MTGGSLSRGVSVHGVSVWRGSLSGSLCSGALCTGGLCPGGLYPRGSLSRGVSVKETPSPTVDRQIPVKLLPCPKLRLRALKIFHSFGHVSTNPATLKLLNHTRHQWLIQDFPDKEGPTPKEHANILFGQNFPKKTA